MLLWYPLIASYVTYEMYVNTVCPFALTGIMCADITEVPITFKYVPLSYELSMDEVRADMGNKYVTNDLWKIRREFEEETSHKTVPVLVVSEPLSKKPHFVRESENVCRYLDNGSIFPQTAMFWDRYHLITSAASTGGREWYQSKEVQSNMVSFLSESAFLSGDRPGFLDIVLYRSVVRQVSFNETFFGN